jgi:hypothetical protein
MPDAAYAELPEKTDTAADWAGFSFSHMAQHRDYIRVIFQRYGVSLPEYVLDPIDPQNVDAWAYHHQMMHDQINAILKISGYNLLTMDFNDRQALEIWNDQNQDLHTRTSSILGL